MSNQGKDFWSDCGQVYFLDGWAWGLTEDCQRIRMGSEAEILQFLEDGIMLPNKSAGEIEALEFIKEYREENGFGTSKTDMVGAGNDGAIGGEQKTTSSTAKGKGLALHTSHKKHNPLFR